MDMIKAAEENLNTTIQQETQLLSQYSDQQVFFVSNIADSGAFCKCPGLADKKGFVIIKNMLLKRAEAPRRH